MKIHHTHRVNNDFFLKKNVYINFFPQLHFGLVLSFSFLVPRSLTATIKNFFFYSLIVYRCRCLFLALIFSILTGNSSHLLCLLIIFMIFKRRFVTRLYIRSFLSWILLSWWCRTSLKPFVWNGCGSKKIPSLTCLL